MIITQDWHNRIVSLLCNWAAGDLMLDGRGNLAVRQAMDPETCKDLPREICRPVEVLATIGIPGWTLTQAGAQFILENCSPEGRADLRKLQALAV